MSNWSPAPPLRVPKIQARGLAVPGGAREQKEDAPHQEQEQRVHLLRPLPDQQPEVQAQPRRMRCPLQQPVEHRLIGRREVCIADLQEDSQEERQQRIQRLVRMEKELQGTKHFFLRPRLQAFDDQALSVGVRWRLGWLSVPSTNWVQRGIVCTAGNTAVLHDAQIINLVPPHPLLLGNLGDLTCSMSKTPGYFPLHLLVLRGVARSECGLLGCNNQSKYPRRILQCILALHPTHLKILDLHGNALETVSALESESLQELYLYDNQIVTFQGKLTIPNLKNLNIGLTMNTSVELWSNQIDSLEQKSFRPMLEELSKGNGYISLFGNPTRCDCSVAWLISSPDLLKSVKDAYCLDGTAFTDFDATLFKRCRLCEHECVDLKQASSCSPGTTTPSRPHDCRPEESCCKPKIPKENPPKCGSKRNVHSSGAANTSMDQTPLNFDEWPWQVAIYSVKEQSIICGGALIREKWVLTSAGCLNKFQDPRTLLVHLEKLHSNESRDDQSMEPIKVSKIILHDDFNAENYDSNVALLKLRKRAQLSQRVQLVCLPSNPGVNLKEGTRGWVVNWGLNGTTEDMVVSKCRQDTAHPITRATSDKVFCSTNNSKNSDSGLLFHFNK
ncbi:unnamed protein product [Darwinula stevensoni]|uniref:Peptidase S1 domain-containing protein n=1 Tax=Darwinula stevensoni TaxID=69355 RepID=A0A7R9ADE3_9CRUS|nr:unnamed protein product [Darwinula stevensoni]CAG0901244.1 unnamed protein product [Darwinula stevensoni]